MTTHASGDVAALYQLMSVKPPASRGSIDIRLAMRVRGLVNRVGDREAARVLGVSVPCVVRASAALAMLRTSIGALHARLDQIEAAEGVPR